MKETRDALKLEITHYMEELPDSRKVFHKWMNYLEVLGIAMIIVAFLLALYFSITWKSVNPMIIPLAWFAFAGSGSLLMVFTGLHSAILHAFPTSILPRNTIEFISGSKATVIGLGFIIGGLVYAAFWGLMAYGTLTANFELLRPLISSLGIILGFGIAISLLVKMASTILHKEK
jgi:hypothetical protein